MLTLRDIKEYALVLARENKGVEPNIQEIYWFPDEHEIRLVESDACMPDSTSVTPIYSDPIESDNPDECIPLPSGIAVIRPEEVGKVSLPEGWGSWDNAIRILPEED
ncbi:MAG: hypothetical protein JXA11_08985 [Phycisphaerae bacterium]|nr:hypothetical protein [Phycisphaerae bacterium]